MRVGLFGKDNSPGCLQRTVTVFIEVVWDVCGGNLVHAVLAIEGEPS